MMKPGPLNNTNASAIYYKYNPLLDYLKRSAYNEEIRAHSGRVSIDIEEKIAICPHTNNKELIQRIGDFKKFLDKKLLSKLFEEIGRNNCTKMGYNRIYELAHEAKSHLDNQDIPSSERWAVLPLFLTRTEKKEIEDLNFKIFEIPQSILKSDNHVLGYFGYKEAIKLIMQIEDKVIFWIDPFESRCRISIDYNYKLEISEPSSIFFGYIND